MRPADALDWPRPQWRAQTRRHRTDLYGPTSDHSGGGRADAPLTRAYASLSLTGFSRHSLTAAFAPPAVAPFSFSAYRTTTADLSRPHTARHGTRPGAGTAWHHGTRRAALRSRMGRRARLADGCAAQRGVLVCRYCKVYGGGRRQARAWLRCAEVAGSGQRGGRQEGTAAPVRRRAASRLRRRSD